MKSPKVVFIGMLFMALAMGVTAQSYAQKSASAKAAKATDTKATEKASDKPFEGVISMIMRIPNDTTAKETTVYLKDGKMMMDVDMGQHGLLKIFPQPENHKAYIAMMQAKRGQEVPLPNAADQPPVDLSSLKATGKKETVSGHKAEGYGLSNPQVEYTFWEAKDLPANIRTVYAAALPHLMQEDPNVRAVVEKLLAEKMVPVKIDINITAIGASASMQFVNAKEKKVEATVFDLPAGIEFAPPPSQQPPPPAPADSTGGQH